MTFDVIMLICQLGQQPAECQAPTARSVMTLERGLHSELECMRAFTMDAPKVASLLDPEHEYPKLACTKGEGDDL